MAAAPGQASIPGNYLKGLATASVDSITLRIPCKGRDDDSTEVELKNITDKRLVFKMSATKADKFLIRPGMGFIEPRKWIDIHFIPKPQTSAEGFSKADKFNFYIAYAPPVDKKLKPQDIWKKGNKDEPKNVENIEIPLKVYDTNNNKFVE